MRSRPEWIGKTPDTAIPDRVQARVAKRANDCCVKCTRQIGPALKGQIDHVTPLILGGANRETNLQLLCVECHKAKTALDVRLKARVAKSRVRNLASRNAKGSKLKSRGFTPAPPQRSASRPLERRS